MRRYVSPLCLLLSATLVLASCLGEDDDEVTLYDDIAITAFQITSAEIQKHTTSSAGEDSVYTETNTAVSSYPFRIDHVNGVIFNPDSLPVGTDATKLLCSWTAKNNGTVYIKNIKGDSVKYLSTTDSTDFTTPRKVVVYSSDYETYREYTVTVNIHREEMGVFRWNRMADSRDLAALQGMRAVTLGGRVLVLGNEGGTTAVYATADGNAWTLLATLPGGDLYNNVVSKNDTLFLLDGGKIRYSVDGASFADVAQATGVARLVGGSTTELYALGADGGLLVSADGGRTWAGDTVDDDPALLPAQDVSYCCTPFAANDSTDYVVLAGSRDVTDYPGDDRDMVWRKIVEYSEGSRSGKWIYMNVDASNLYPLPRLAGLTLVGYDSSVLAFGGRGMGTCGKEAFSQIYESRDGGITWKYNANYVYPDGFDSSETSFAAVADDDNNLWLVCGGTGQVWRGRLNNIDGQEK